MLVNDVRQVGGETVYKPFIRLLKDCAARRCVSPSVRGLKPVLQSIAGFGKGAQGFFDRTVPKSPCQYRIEFMRKKPLDSD